MDNRIGEFGSLYAWATDEEIVREAHRLGVTQIPLLQVNPSGPDTAEVQWDERHRPTVRRFKQVPSTEQSK